MAFWFTFGDTFQSVNLIEMLISKKKKKKKKEERERENILFG